MNHDQSILRWPENVSVRAENCRRTRRSSQNPNIAIYKEAFIALIRKVVNEEFRKQEKQITNILISNSNVTKQELGELSNEISELKQSLEFEESVLEKKMVAATIQVKKLEKYLENLEREVTELQDYGDDAEEIHEQLIEFNDHPRSNKLWFEGIK